MNIQATTLAIALGHGLSDPRVTFKDEHGNNCHVWIDAVTLEMGRAGPMHGKRLRGKPVVYVNPPDGHGKPTDPGYFQTRYIDLGAKVNLGLAELIRVFVGDGRIIREAQAAVEAEERQKREAERAKHANAIRTALIQEAERHAREGEHASGKALADLAESISDDNAAALVTWLGSI